MNNEKLLFKGYGFCWGNKMLILKTEHTKRTQQIYNKFIDYMCDIKGITDKKSQYTEHNYKALKFGVTPISYYDCGIYISIRFNNGQANYPKADIGDIMIFE